MKEVCVFLSMPKPLGMGFLRSLKCENYSGVVFVGGVVLVYYTGLRGPYSDSRREADGRLCDA